MSPQVQLIEVTKDNLRDVLGLSILPAQTKFVAPNAVSISEAYFENAAWFRAIAAGDKLVGFVMLFDPSRSDTKMTEEERAGMYLWRLMIGSDDQGKGYGRAALDLILAYSRTRPGIKCLLSSYLDADGSAADFYLKYGFTKTGNLPDGEVEITIDL